MSPAKSRGAGSLSGLHHTESICLDNHVYAELKRIFGLQWVHEIKETPWGQRDIRVYDPDKHIVEIAEDMSTVIKRFFNQSMPVEEIARYAMFSLEIVKQYGL